MDRWIPKRQINMWPGRCNSLGPYSDASTTQRSLYRRTHQSALESKTNAEPALGTTRWGAVSGFAKRQPSVDGQGGRRTAIVHPALKCHGRSSSTRMISSTPTESAPSHMSGIAGATNSSNRSIEVGVTGWLGGGAAGRGVKSARDRVVMSMSLCDR